MKKTKHQRPPAFAEIRFAKRARDLKGKNHLEIFSYIHNTNLWGADTSKSGLGSELAATNHIREEIPKLLCQINAHTMLDIPCGDFTWLRTVSLPISKYIGADIVESIIVKLIDEKNSDAFANVNSKTEFEFCRLDMAKDFLPQVDIIFCRDALVHFSYKSIGETIGNFKRTGSRFLLATTFTEISNNSDIQDGDWRPLNFELPPFRFPKPKCVINERCTEANGAYFDKSLGLWEIATLPDLVI